MHRIHELVLRHPPTWLAPRHPERMLAQADTETWLREQGVLVGHGGARLAGAQHQHLADLGVFHLHLLGGQDASILCRHLSLGQVAAHEVQYW